MTDFGRFFGHFNTYLYHLISTPESLQYATRQVLQDFADDGVVYLELRTTPRPFPPNLEAEDTIDLILSVIEEWNSTSLDHSSPGTSASGSTNSRPTMLVNLILSIDRAKHTSQQAEQIVNLAIRSKTSGRPVVGIDLAGDPTVPTDLKSFRPAFVRAKSSGLGVTVHFAELPSETLGEEMREMLDWGPDRLGHVIHVPLEIREEIVRRKIGVELCLTCNVLAGMLPPPSIPSPTAHEVSSNQQHQQPQQRQRPSDIAAPGYQDHHFAWWWSNTPETYPLSLGTDDVGVFLSSSSDEYYLASTHFKLDESQLKELTRRAALGAFDERAIDIVDGRLAVM